MVQQALASVHHTLAPGSSSQTRAPVALQPAALPFASAPGSSQARQKLLEQLASSEEEGAAGLGGGLGVGLVGCRV